MMGDSYIIKLISYSYAPETNQFPRLWEVNMTKGGTRTKEELLDEVKHINIELESLVSNRSPWQQLYSPVYCCVQLGGALQRID
jgi:hypothetical protein